MKREGWQRKGLEVNKGHKKNGPQAVFYAQN